MPTWTLVLSKEDVDVLLQGKPLKAKIPPETTDVDVQLSEDVVRSFGRRPEDYRHMG